MEIVKNSAKDCYPAVQKTTLVIMERLQQVLQMEVSSRCHSCESSHITLRPHCKMWSLVVKCLHMKKQCPWPIFLCANIAALSQSHIQSTSDRIQYNDLQSLLCATLQVCAPYNHTTNYLLFKFFLFFIYMNSTTDKTEAGPIG